MKLKLLLILLLFIPVFAMAQSPAPSPKPKRITFEGVWVSIAKTSPYDKWRKFNKSDINLELTAIFGLPRKFAFHLEIIYPVGEKPLLRVALAKRIF